MTISLILMFSQFRHVLIIQGKNRCQSLKRVKNKLLITRELLASNMVNLQSLHIFFVNGVPKECYYYYYYKHTYNAL